MRALSIVDRDRRASTNRISLTLGATGAGVANTLGADPLVTLGMLATASLPILADARLDRRSADLPDGVREVPEDRRPQPTAQTDGGEER